METPYGIVLVGYVNDLAAVITELYAQLAQLNQIICLVEGWMHDYYLQLAASLTEIAMLTKKANTHNFPDADGFGVIKT